jgi:hypothetical protein
MATNLISLVTQVLTPEVIARIASALGLDRTILQKAVTAAIPALLAYLANAVSKPGGERQLANAIGQQPPGTLDKLLNIISGSGQKARAERESFVESGSSLLSGLLGGSTQDALTRAIGRYAGIGEGTSKSLFGMLGPVVLDTLGQQQRNAGLDVSGLANLLTAQKQQIAAAFPSGFSEQLSAAGLGDVLESSMREGARAASGAASRIGSASRAAMASATQAAPAARTAQWPYWVLGLAALAGLAWLALGNWGGQRVAEQPRPTAIQSPPTGIQSSDPRETVGLAPANLTVGGVNLADQVRSSIGDLRTTLVGITDSASAQAALPKVREVTAQLDKVHAMSAQLPKESRGSLSALIAAAMPTINSAIEKILATPGVGDIVRPALTELRTRLDTLARA